MPLWEAALCEVREDPHVQADETSARTQTRRERSFVWTFLSKVHTVYVFAPDRSGETPRRVLGGTVGSLVVDGFTGYNKVSTVDGRLALLPNRRFGASADGAVFACRHSATSSRG